MTNQSLPTPEGHSIADVERDTGLSKDTLRVWERRYGFPTPTRDAQGERRYGEDQLVRLRHIRRLIDAGHRPGQVVALPLERLLELDTSPPARRIQTPDAGADTAAEREHWLRLLRAQDAPALRARLQLMLAERGLGRTIVEGIAPMNVQVGQAWLDGALAVYEEHLYTEIVQATLRQSLALVAGARPAIPPRVLLTTLPGEVHALGLLMAECFLVLERCHTIPLGTQTPLGDVVKATEAGSADIVALSFTAGQNPREVKTALQQLRERLPAHVEIWAGGQCPALYKPLPRGEPRVFYPMGRLQDVAVGVARWRAEAAQRA